MSETTMLVIGERAIERFPTHPMLLQRFHKGRLVEHPYLDPDTGRIEHMRGRARLCPYYFLDGGKAHFARRSGHDLPGG